MEREELTSYAIKIKEFCETQDNENCKECPFGHPYGTRYCRLNNIPEAWEVYKEV